MEKQRPDAGAVFDVRLTRKQMEAYLEKLEASGRSAVTLQSYRNNLEHFWRFLPADKVIREGTLTQWQASMLESGYSVNTVNAGTSVVNGLLVQLGCWQLQALRLPEAEDNVPLELTRAEYLRLLSTARMLERKRAYLLIKVFGSTGLSVGELKELTAEAVGAGKITSSAGTRRIPASLREELLEFLREEGITSGPVFVTREGKPQDRTTVTSTIQALCRDARVEEEKATPRCLKKLYQATWGKIQEQYAFLLEQAYANLLDTEQNIIGWET